jgi:hypothetical protein
MKTVPTKLVTTLAACGSGKCSSPNTKVMRLLPTAASAIVCDAWNTAMRTTTRRLLNLLLYIHGIGRAPAPASAWVLPFDLLGVWWCYEHSSSNNPSPGREGEPERQRKRTHAPRMKAAARMPPWRGRQGRPRQSTQLSGGAWDLSASSMASLSLYLLYSISVC